jgi:membrane associated rhomboid family serine protease
VERGAAAISRINLMRTAGRRVWLTLALIALNLLVFGYQSTLSAEQSEQFILRWAAVPVEIVEGNDLPPRVPFPVAGTLLSALFIHVDGLHLATNLALLALFGTRAERALGGARMLGLYLIGGVAGTLAQIATNPHSLTVQLGASGAIAALMGATLALPPRPGLHMLVLIAWATIQVAAAADQLANARVLGGSLAVWSHLGGLAFGLALTLLLRRHPRAPQ